MKSFLLLIACLSLMAAGCATHPEGAPLDEFTTDSGSLGPGPTRGVPPERAFPNTGINPNIGRPLPPP